MNIMTMKKRTTYGGRPASLSLLLTIGLALTCPGASLAPRKDINPALLYWQAFGLLPDLTDSENSMIRQDDPEVGAPQSAQLAARFDSTMKMLRRAAHMQVPCDWGVDLADGPEALLPNLIKVRTTVYAALYRAQHFLATGQPKEAEQDLIAELTLARLTGRDATLVSTMIGISMESLAQDFLAKNMHRFPRETLMELEQSLRTLPPRSTVQTAMNFEKAAFLDWMRERFNQIRTNHPADEIGALKEIRELLRQILGDDGSDDSDVSRLIQAAGGTSAGLVTYFKQAEPLYDAIQPLATASPETLAREIDRLAEIKEKGTNLIGQLLLPNVGKARSKELEIMARDAMVRAALAYRLRGEKGLNEVPDPFGQGPFVLKRLDPAQGLSGFELKSGLEEFGLKGKMSFQDVDEGSRKSPQKKSTGTEDFQ